MTYPGDKRSEPGTAGWVCVRRTAITTVAAAIVCLPFLTPSGHAQGFVIETTPPGAEIFQAGKRLGAAGDLLAPGPGEIELIIRKEGYRTE